MRGLKAAPRRRGHSHLLRLETPKGPMGGGWGGGLRKGEGGVQTTEVPLGWGVCTPPCPTVDGTV